GSRSPSRHPPSLFHGKFSLELPSWPCSMRTFSSELDLLCGWTRHSHRYGCRCSYGSPHSNPKIARSEGTLVPTSCNSVFIDPSQRVHHWLSQASSESFSLSRW